MEWSSDDINGAITAAAKDLGFSTLTREQTLVLQTFLSGNYDNVQPFLVVASLCVTGSSLERLIC